MSKQVQIKENNTLHNTTTENQHTTLAMACQTTTIKAARKTNGHPAHCSNHHQEVH